MSNAVYQATLDQLEAELAPIEKQYRELVTIINGLRARAGMPPRPGGGGHPQEGESGAGPTVTDIKSDTFVGKRLQSAVRDYLNIRRARLGDGPATPRQIYDGLVSGGYEFTSPKEETRLIIVRNLLRKRSEVFKRFDTGKYGLNEWYGIHPKKSKTSSQDNDDDDDEAEPKAETATPKKAAAS